MCHNFNVKTIIAQSKTGTDTMSFTENQSHIRATKKMIQVMKIVNFCHFHVVRNNIKLSKSLLLDSTLTLPQVPKCSRPSAAG